MRCVRGIEVSEDTVGLETMRATCLGGPGSLSGFRSNPVFDANRICLPDLGRSQLPQRVARKKSA
jgi:hypothetical protein